MNPNSVWLPESIVTWYAKRYRLKPKYAAHAIDRFSRRVFGDEANRLTSDNLRELARHATAGDIPPPRGGGESTEFVGGLPSTLMNIAEARDNANTAPDGGYLPPRRLSKCYA